MAAAVSKKAAETSGKESIAIDSFPRKYFVKNETFLRTEWE